MEKLLITGSEGKIGTVLKGPLNNLYEVYAVDQVEGSSDRFYQADISYLELLKEVFKKISREVQGPGFFIIIAGNSTEDFVYKKKVLEKKQKISKKKAKNSGFAISHQYFKKEKKR